MKKIKFIPLCLVALLFVSLDSCKKKDDPVATSTADLTVYKKIYGVTADVYQEGEYVVIKTNGQPDHKSPYYPTTNSLYQAYSGTTFGGGTFAKNPNTIASFNYVFKIPLNPAPATTKSSTPLGAMGVSINGVPFYNQYAGPNQPLTSEINSFDQYYGHPQQAGAYHYHVEPIYLTGLKGKDALLGFLLDGYPVYGPTENGKTLVSSDLDAYHGHTTATSDYPKGIYHYHITADSPYINGNGFYGTPGTVTQ